MGKGLKAGLLKLLVAAVAFKKRILVCDVNCIIFM